MTEHERRSLVDGVINFRDLGGYATSDGGEVRRGVLYRAGSLHALDEADLARLRELGIRTAFDLRSAAEQSVEPLAAPFIQHVPAPLERSEGGTPITDFDDGVAYLRERYQEILFELAPTIGTVLRALARHDDAVPAVIHCAAGKDRTGVVVAVLLLTLGVGDDDVLHDYELTSAYESAERAQELAAKLTALPPALAAGLLGTDPTALTGALAELRRRHGSVESYLVDAAALTTSDIDELRARFTSGPGGERRPPG